jgi:hypothetical protein
VLIAWLFIHVPLAESPFLKPNRKTAKDIARSSHPREHHHHFVAVIVLRKAKRRRVATDLDPSKLAVEGFETFATAQNEPKLPESTRRCMLDDRCHELPPHAFGAVLGPTLQTLDSCPVTREIRSIEAKRHPADEFVSALSNEQHKRARRNIVDQTSHRGAHFILGHGDEWEANRTAFIADVEPTASQPPANAIFHYESVYETGPNRVGHTPTRSPARPSPTLSGCST